MYIFLLQFTVILLTGIYIIYKDTKERIIPNKIIILLLVAGLIITVLDNKNIISHISGFFIVGCLLLGLAIITKGFGMGDVKYVFCIGLILGLSNALYALIFAFILGGIVTGLLLILKKVKRKDYIAFGPYLVIGSLIALLYSVF